MPPFEPFNSNWSYQSPYTANNTGGFTGNYNSGFGQAQQGGFSSPYSSGYYNGYSPMFNQGLPASPSAAAAAPVAPAQQPPASSNNFNPISFGLGAIQTGVGLYQLNKLSKTPVPEYKATNETLAAAQRAQQNAQMGYTPSQAAAFKANMGTALNTQFANQRNLAGGNLAGALGARGTAQKLQAMNQFAASDADRQMQNIRYADEQTAGLQRMQNMNTEAAMRRRLMTEQALGAAVQQGTTNMANSFDTGASFASFAKMFAGG
jgi:hypothetical protein